MIVWTIALILSVILTIPVGSEQKNNHIAWLITQEATGSALSTVDKNHYFIFTLKRKIDCITCTVIPNSDPTKIYVDKKNYPVSDIGIARKIEVIDYVQQLQEGELQKDQLIKKIKTLQKSQRNIPDLDFADASLDATIGLVNLMNIPKTVIDGILKLINGVAGKVFEETLFSTMEKLRNRTFEDFGQAINSYLKIYKEIEKSRSTKVEDYDIARKILDEYQLAKDKEKSAHLLAKKIYNKSDYDAAEIIGDRLINGLTMGYTDEVIARHIEIDLIGQTMSQVGIQYNVALYTQKLAKNCGWTATVPDNKNNNCPTNLVFESGIIIPDNEVPYVDIPVEVIQEFLDDKDSLLKDLDLNILHLDPKIPKRGGKSFSEYIDDSKDGWNLNELKNDKPSMEQYSPAKIIYLSAKENCVNPVILLAYLQKEQSLIEKQHFKNPLQTVLNRATGYMMTEGGDDPIYYSFLAQLTGLSSQIYKDMSGFKEKYEKIIDNNEIFIKSKFAHFHYQYTAHYGSAVNLFSAYNEYRSYFLDRGYSMCGQISSVQSEDPTVAPSAPSGLKVE
jgi:effector-binding domain-containing protein